jgi:hypothetical protein
MRVLNLFLRAQVPQINVKCDCLLILASREFILYLYFAVHSHTFYGFQLSREYCAQKGITEEIQGSVFSKKWANIKTNAKKKKSAIKREMFKTGGGLAPTMFLDSIDEQVLAASQSNYDLPSHTDSESHIMLVNRKYIRMFISAYQG